MKYMFLTDDPETAAFVSRSGVQRIFLDLELLGKVERQAGRDTVVSRHRASQIRPVKQAIVGADLLVRTNPLHDDSAAEIDYCIASGADLLMLPMCRSRAEVAAYSRLVAGRVPVCPLIETAGAVRELTEILGVPGVSEIHVGLNDLHLELGCRFMLELVANGVVDEIADQCRRSGAAYGIGGIATLSGGRVPGAMLLGEYVRLGSGAVILSREFSRRARDVAELREVARFAEELQELEAARRRLAARDSSAASLDSLTFRRCVEEVAKTARAA